MDEQVEKYMLLLKKMYYNDGSIQRDGKYVLKEMIVATKALIKTKKNQVDSNLDFLNIRGERLNALLEELQAYTDEIALKNKYSIFWSNAQSLVNVSETMNSISSKINFTVVSMLDKIRAYEREYIEVVKRITFLSELLDFYETSDEELAEIEELL